MKPLIRVLYVDDNPLDRELVRDALEKEQEGFQVTEASSRQEFEARLQEGGFDLVLSDFDILGFEGLQVIKAVKAKDPYLPVIIVTGTGSEEIAVEAMRSGASDYVIKTPGHIQRLPLTIQKVLERRQLRAEKARSLAELQEARRDWEEIFQAIGQPTFLLNPKQEIVAANRAALVALRRPAAEILGRKCYELLHSRSNDSAACCPMEKLLVSGRMETMEMEVEALGGFYLVSCTPIFDDQGKLQKVIHIATDITGRRQAEEALEEEAIRRRILVEQSRDGIVVLDQTGKVYEANQRYAEMLGYTAEELSQLYVWDWDVQWTREELLEKIKNIDVPGEHFETRHRRKDGTIYDVEISTNGAVLGGRKLVFCVCRDISQRKAAELALRESEEKYRLLVNQIPAVVFRGYTDGSIDTFDRKIETLTGYPKEDFDSRRRKWSDLILAEDLAAAKNEFLAGLKTTGAYEKEYRIRKKSGEIIWVQVHGQIFLDGAGRIDFVNGVIFDVSDRKNLEEERDHLFNMSMDMFCVAGFDGFFKQLNPAWSKTLGWPETELLSRPWLDFVHPEDRPATAAAGERLQTGQPVIQFENRYQCLDGSYRWVSWNSFPLLEEKLIFAVARDITEKRHMEEQLLKAQKMEAVGRLAGGVAHDFNNLLTAITGYSEMMLMDLRPEDPLYSFAEEITKAVNRGASLTNQLLAFSRKQILQPRVINLNDMVQDMDKMLCRLIGEDIGIVTVIDPELGLVKADPGQVEQIIMNLAVNARDAMPHGGKLTIETANVDLDQAYAQGREGVTPGPYVMLAVSDNGTGMDTDTLSHIFEPFFTTKESGKGTGLGLATVYGVVKQSGGHIWVYSEPGQGTTLKVYLPRVEESLEMVKPKAAPVTSLEGKETILLVEDDVGLRELISTALRKYGFTVLEAAQGGEALLLCEREKAPIHLLLTDVVMPQISGTALAGRLKLLHPEMQVLFMSGYTEDAIVHHGVLNSDVNFIPKPFRMVALVQKVREVLDNASTS
jgi:two-component system cell cycle sensor histidine kinase/response regulator CckA